ncbi:hypothetical protein [Clostridium sp.]|uniref:hypothetical protein n=1 Tax=Clostridium sp. TaxID=1506 RepID=UPI0026040A8E|nr:hypothetical protein [Clostridium sp.]
MAIKSKSTGHKKHKVEEIKGSYKFTYIKFNFSFLTTNKQYNFENPKMMNDIKIQIFDRILYWSSMTTTALGTLGKNLGYETIEESQIKINAKCNSNFGSDEERGRACSDKYYVFRGYPNNNPYTVRLIGKWAKGIFYLFFIDLEHKYI